MGSILGASTTSRFKDRYGFSDGRSLVAGTGVVQLDAFFASTEALVQGCTEVIGKGGPKKKSKKSVSKKKASGDL